MKIISLKKENKPFSFNGRVLARRSTGRKAGRTVQEAERRNGCLKLCIECPPSWKTEVLIAFMPLFWLQEYSVMY